jgi:hypothetical protein
MITRGHLAAFVRFDGNADGYVRTAKRSDPDPVSDQQWYLIQGLLQELALVAGGMASKAYAARIRKRVAESTADADTAAEMLRMSGLDPPTDGVPPE